MKLSEFKYNLKLRFTLLKANILFSFKNEIAYAGNNWGVVLSTFFYTISILLFTEILFTQVNTIAGYTKNEILFLFFIGQFMFYFNWLTYIPNLTQLILDVNRGGLDMLLTKPVPHLFFILTQKIRTLSVLSEVTPAMIVLILSINWNTLVFMPSLLFLGAISIISGIIIAQAILFFASLPVFWLGESESILSLADHAINRSGMIIPFEGYGEKSVFLFSSLLPIIVASEMSTSIILGKSPAMWNLYIGITLAILFTVLKFILWNTALKAYTSASS